MDSTITLPLWLFVLIAVFAAIMVLDRFLMPGMRWYFRRRVNRVIDEINTRLDVEIRPLQITQRKESDQQFVAEITLVEDYALPDGYLYIIGSSNEDEYDDYDTYDDYNDYDNYYDDELLESVISL